VFLHGFPEFWWSWRHQIDAFAAAGFRVVAPDLRGYNESDKPAGVRACEVEALAGDVAGLIRALGRTEATIVGHDWGAVVAWSFAMFHGAMTTRLAILNVPHPVAMLRGLRTLRQPRKRWYVFVFQLPRVPEWVITRHDFAFIRQTFADDGVPAADIQRYVLALCQPGAVSAAVNDHRAAIRRSFTGRQVAITPIAVPVLVIWGDRDRYLGSELATAAARLRAQLSVTPPARKTAVGHRATAARPAASPPGSPAALPCARWCRRLAAAHAPAAAASTAAG
jgi:epoxide hydrolase 4